MTPPLSFSCDSLADLQTHIPRLLGAKCKMYTTACVMKELRSMGKDFGPTTRAAGNYEIHKCGHTKGESKPAAECIMEQIGECGSVEDRECDSVVV